MRIFIGINTLTSIEQPVYSNHLQFFFRLGRNTQHDFAINTPRRMSIDRMRNQTAKLALEWEADYLMFIDDDVVIPINSLDRLINCNSDIAAGWTLIRGYPFQNMFYRYVDGNPQAIENFPDSALPIIADQVKVDAVGFSCALIKCELLKKVPQPWFVTGPSNTEDIYFCIKARHFLPDTSIVVDTSIKTSHALGTEYISPDTKEAYRNYHEVLYPDSAKEREKEVDRGEGYLEMVKGAVQ